MLPLTLVGSAIAQVFYQRTAELRSNVENLSRSVELVFRRLVAIGLFPAIVLGIAGPELFEIVFRSNWVEAGRYAQILSPWMFVLFISSPLSTLFATPASGASLDCQFHNPGYSFCRFGDWRYDQ